MDEVDPLAVQLAQHEGIPLVTSKMESEELLIDSLKDLYESTVWNKADILVITAYFIYSSLLRFSAKADVGFDVYLNKID